MKKFFPALIFSLLTSVIPSAAQIIAVLNGPSAIPLAYIMEENVGNEYDFLSCASAQIALPKLIKGEADFGFLPPNLAAKVFTESNEALLCLGVCGNGNLFLLTKDETFSDLSGLEGKTVACAGQGATPEYVMEYLLREKNIENVTLDFSTPNPQIAPMLISGKFDFALVPEPFASVAQSTDASVKRFSLSEEFSSLSGGKDFPMTVLVVNKKYAKKHKKQIGRFIQIYESAVKRTNENPKEAAELAEKHGLGLKAAIAEKAIPNCAFTWKSAKDSKAEIEMLLKIFGQPLPKSGFYYSK